MISELFSHVARRYGNELAIIDGDERITYTRLLQQVARMRDWLQTTLNAGPGDVIAASMRNTWQFVACFFAASELGAVLMPCNPQWRARELRWFAARLRFCGAISERRFLQKWEQVGEILPPERIVTLDEEVGRCAPGLAPGTCRAQQISEDSPAIYLATSGSIGAPRIVPRSHRNLLASAMNLGRGLGIGPGRRFLSAVPFHHSYGLNSCMLMPLMNGAAVLLLRNFTPAACAELIRRERANVLIGSPFIYGHLADHVTDNSLLATLGLCISSGARMPAGVAESWQGRFGLPVRQLYGSTETGTVAIDCSGRDAPPPNASDFVGAPISGVEVRCLGPGGEDLGAGHTGEIAVRSPAVMSGYFGEPERNKHIFQDGFFRTRDLGHIDSDGSIYLKSRLGRVLNVAGVKVDPVEVERAVETLPGVSACHVDAVRGGREGEVMRARVVARPGFQLSRRVVIEQCRQWLAEYKLPRVIEVVETLPVTISGKIPGKWQADEFPDKSGS